MLKKLVDLFRPSPDSSDKNVVYNNVSESVEGNNSGFVISDNSIESRKKLAKAIVKALLPCRYSKKKIQNIFLYIHESDNDSGWLSIVNDEEFENYLRLELENSSLTEALESRLEYLNQPPKMGATAISQGIYLQWNYNIIKEAEFKARITAIEGSLSNESYTIEGISTQTFNIGRGEKQKLNTGPVHVNQIVIKDDEQDPEYEKNRYVSRRHACIIHSDKGFSLKVYEGGCHISGGRTRIFRGEERIDLQNPMLEYPLQHNDQIELSKNVILLFEIN